MNVEVSSSQVQASELKTTPPVELRLDAFAGDDSMAVVALGAVRTVTRSPFYFPCTVCPYSSIQAHGWVSTLT